MGVLVTAIREEKEVKRIQIRKEVKLSLFADDMILYIDNSKDAIREPREPINKFGKVSVTTRDQIANICWIIEKAREFQKKTYFCFIDYAKAFDCVYHNKLWKILKEMGIPDHLTCLLRNLYTGQEAIVRTGHGTTDWFQIGKGVHQGCILSPFLFNFYADYIMRNAGLEEAQAGIKIAGRNINNPDMQITPPLWQKVKKN